MPLWGWQADSSPHQQAAWCTVLLNTTECCTWTSSKMVACSWLVSVVRCFWSSNLVLDEFIPVGKRKGQRIYEEVQSWSYHLPNAFLHTLTLPLQGASTWRQLHESTLLSQFHIQENQGHGVYKTSSNNTVCTLPQIHAAPNHFLGVKILQTIQTFSSKTTNSSNYMRTWKASGTELKFFCISPLNCTYVPFIQQLTWLTVFLYHVLHILGPVR